MSEGQRPSEQLEERLRVFDEGDLSAQEETELFQQLLDTGQIDDLPDRYKEIARDFQREGAFPSPKKKESEPGPRAAHLGPSLLLFTEVLRRGILRSS